MIVFAIRNTYLHSNVHGRSWLISGYITDNNFFLHNRLVIKFDIRYVYVKVTSKVLIQVDDFVPRVNRVYTIPPSTTPMWDAHV